MTGGEQDRIQLGFAGMAGTICLRNLAPAEPVDQGEMRPDSVVLAFCCCPGPGDLLHALPDTMNTMTRRWLVLLLWCGAMVRIPAQEWTRFRGPNGSGLSAAKTIPTTWTEKDINWRAPLPGPGHSSPVVWGDRVFVTAGDAGSNQIWVLCLCASQGGILWQRAYPITPYHRNAANSVASGTPAVDEHRVYVAWNDAERLTLRALDHAGKPVWERDLGPFASQHGGGASPLVYGDEVVLAKEHDGESYLIAVDAATGATRWQTPRKTEETAYATPCVYEPKEGPAALVFASHAHGISGINPANGKVLWELTSAFDKRVVCSPIIAAGLVVAACGSGAGGNFVVAVRPGEAASGRPAALAYTVRRAAPYVPTSLCLGDLLFLWGDDGAVSCVQAATGDLKWQERVGKHFYSSPVCVDGRLFCVSTTGDVVVVRAGDHFELLATNALGEPAHSTPAVAAGRMFIHTTRHLISIGGARTTPAE